MTSDVAHILEQARKLTPRKQLELIQALAELAGNALPNTPPYSEAQASGTVLHDLLDLAAQHDPVLELLGAYASTVPLIDDIPVSADPDLYLAAEASGAQAKGLHAWEIAPARYERGPDGRAVRKE